MKGSLLDRLLLRTNSVDDVLRAFNKAQQKLDQAKALSAEAERATTVASKLHELTN